METTMQNLITQKKHVPYKHNEVFSPGNAWIKNSTVKAC